MRGYDPTTGRYIQADPLGLVDGASVYGYARGNPGRYSDPSGLDTSFTDIARGYGSYWRGLGRCIAGYCRGRQVYRELQKFNDLLESSPEAKECFKLLLLKGLEKNPSYVTGRMLGSYSAGALSRLGTRGANSIFRAGIQGGTSLGTGLAAGLGDLGYKTRKLGNVSPADILEALFGARFEWALDEIGCGCQEILRDY